MNRDFVNNGKFMAIALMTIITSTGISPEARGGEGGAFVGGLLGGHILTNMQNQSERRTRAQEQMATQPRTTAGAQQQPAAAPASSGSSSGSSTQSVEDKLQTLDRLAAEGYISKEEYTKRRQAILDSM